MKNVGGNITAQFQVKTTEQNNIGEHVASWQDCVAVSGWLDLQSGSSSHTNFDAKLQESTHIFICDHQKLSGSITEDGEEKEVACSPENSRLVVNGQVYEILLIDNPMEMDEHYEIYLKYVGGQDGNNI